MTHPIVEFVCWAASPSYIRDPTLLRPAIDIIRNSDGNLGVFTGLVEEDGTTLYMAIVWQTFDHHQKLMDDKDTYAKLFEAVAPVSLHGGSDIKMIHIDFGAVNYTPTFTSGTMEYTTVVLKEGKTRAQAEAAIARLNDLFVDDDNVTYPGLVGWVKEDPQTCVLALGWTDSKAHVVAARSPKYTPAVAALWEFLTPKAMVHIKLIEANEPSKRSAL